MSSVSYDFEPLQRTRLRAPRLRRLLAYGWRQSRPLLLVGLPIFLLLTAVGLAVLGFRTIALDHKVAALRAGENVEIGINSAPELLLARIQYLLAHDQVDEVQPFVEALDRSGSARTRSVAHYNFANGRLRQAFDEIGAGKTDKAGPFVVLSRQEYRRALTLEPEFWDAKFNLDVASRLVRDFPDFERTMGDEVKTNKKLWTDVPGKPEGLP